MKGDSRMFKCWENERERGESLLLSAACRKSWEDTGEKYILQDLRNMVPESSRMMWRCGLEETLVGKTPAAQDRAVWCP